MREVPITISTQIVIMHPIPTLFKPLFYASLLTIMTCVSGKQSGTFNDVNPADSESASDSSDADVDADSGNQPDTANDSVEGYAYQQPNPSICDATLNLDTGFLCAIRPSRLDSAARDLFATGNPPDESLGFGYHVIAFPNSDTAIHGVHLHFTGSMGRAYSPNSARFPSQTLLSEAMASGFITIQIAYHNRYPVNSEQECEGANDVDNCAGLVRYEKITGEDVTSVVDVPHADSIIGRIVTLASYCEGVGFEFPSSVVSAGEVDWKHLRLSGHSQGAGHALYVTKYWNSEHTCLLGGPYDVPDTVPLEPTNQIADWYLDASAPIDRSKIQALVSADDSNYNQFTGTYTLLGLEEGVHWQSFSAPSYSDWEGKSINGHAAVVHDPDFQEQRFSACFAEE